VVVPPAEVPESPPQAVMASAAATTTAPNGKRRIRMLILSDGVSA
jgi:hypothetical protein